MDRVPPPALSPAQDAFLACIRLYFRDPGAAARLQESTNKELDWDHLIALASYHGVIPLVRASLLQSETAIPKSARQRLDEDFSACAALSLLYARELARLPFRANGIPALALKGPPLAVQLYGKTSLRQCRDIDILVPKSELPRAMAVLNASGYRLDDSYTGRDDAVQTDKHLLFIDEDNGAKLELHWAITLPARHIHLDFETLWSRRDEVSVFGTPVAVPGRSDLPLILSVHGSCHYWTSLKWVCDIAALLQRHPNLDWECVRKRAAIAGCGRVLLVAIALANQLTAVPVPPTLEESIQKDPTVGLLAREGHCRILAMRTLSFSDSADWFQRLFTEIRSRERVRDRVRLASEFVRSTIARENGNDRTGLPSPVSMPIHIARLLRKSWRNALRLLTTVTAAR